MRYLSDKYDFKGRDLSTKHSPKRSKSTKANGIKVERKDASSINYKIMANQLSERSMFQDLPQSTKAGNGYKIGINRVNQSISNPIEQTLSKSKNNLKYQNSTLASQLPTIRYLTNNKNEYNNEKRDCSFDENELSEFTRNRVYKLSSIINNCDRVTNQSKKLGRKIQIKAKVLNLKHNKMTRLLKDTQKKHLQELGLPFI